MEFKSATLDTGARILTCAVTVLLVGLATLFLFLVPFGWIFAILMMLIIAVTYLLAPKRIVLTATEMIIEKNIGRKIIIPLGDLMGYTRIPDFSKLTVARTLGNGGLFGYYGMFSTAEYGDITCQLTSLKNIFLIKTKSRVYAVSPAQHSLFEEHISNMPSATGTIARLEPITEPITYANKLILLVPIVLFVIISLFVILNFLQLPERIAVHFDAYGNPDRWGPKSSYLISGLVPSFILLIISIAAFFIVRRAARNQALPLMIVTIVACIQLFIAYTTVETYWVNKYGTHLIPLVYGMSAFVLVMVVLYVFYVRKVITKRRS
jgi:hypothetical protein